MAGRDFIFREEWLSYMDGMDQTQKDNVVRAIITFAFGGNVDDSLELPEKIAFNCIKGSVSRDREKYDNKVERNRKNGQKGGRPKADDKNPLGYLGFSEKPNEITEKSWVSDENPTKIADLGKNPILIPILYPNPISQSYFYSCCSFAVATEKEQEEELILSKFTFEKNWDQPNEEYRRLVSFNSLEGRCWKNMSLDERGAAVSLWRQTPAKAPRFSEPQRKTWQGVYETLLRLDAPRELRMDALRDDVRLESDSGTLNIWATGRLVDFIEHNLDSFRDILSRYMQYKGCSKIQYKLCAV